MLLTEERGLQFQIAQTFFPLLRVLPGYSLTLSIAIEPTEEAGRLPADPTMGTNLASNNLEVDVIYLYSTLGRLTITDYSHRMMLTLYWIPRELIVAVLQLIHLISVDARTGTSSYVTSLKSSIYSYRYVMKVPFRVVADFNLY
jgi:hypothetical protein